MLRVDYALRGVVTAAPKEPIRLLFVPSSLWVGGFLSLLAAGVMAAMVAARWGGRRDG